MARKEDKQKALELRKKGYSYSQIKEKLGLSKSTLSGWLSDYPLSAKRIQMLRDKNPRRIEKFRNTMKKKKDERLEKVYDKVGKDIGVFSKKDIFVAGWFLYWGEGLKTSSPTFGLSNTDPNMIRFFLRWVEILGVPKEKVTITLHLYSDMDINKEIYFWSKELSLPKSCFRKPVIKKTKLSGLTYKNGFGHGTCHVRIYNRDWAEYILKGLQYIREVESKRL